MRNHFYVGALALSIGILLTGFSCKKGKEESEPIPSMPIEIACEGNSWYFRDPGTPHVKTFDYTQFTWSDSQTILRTYFRVEKAGEIHIGLMARVDQGKSLLQTDFQGQKRELQLSSKTYANTYLGSYQIDSPGYYYLDIKGLNKESLRFADVHAILLGGSATSSGVRFVDEEYFYWGRRGPSVHLSYEVPSQAGDILWYYNEVHVPAGQDIPGSFYMANGFGEGYFGFQVNSPTERRVLFSVWSPYHTDNPSEIPADQRVQLLRKSQDVVVNDFGNEGSGGQSFLRYNWQAGTTYRFLLKGQPATDQHTDYTAWFYAPEEGHWKLIASWRRPKTHTYLKRPHSFLENFDTQTGPLVRMAHYGNQWIRDTQGQWFELTRARFTADATARAGARLDYAGGLESGNERFFMKNCGFFSQTTPVDTYFTRKALGIIPEIDLDNLP